MQTHVAPNRTDLGRREFLLRAGTGFGAVALGSVLQQDGRLPVSQAQAASPAQLPKAKSVIWLFMNGGPSGIDLFDYKPALSKWDGTFHPGGVKSLFPHPGPIMESPFKFRQHGQSGAYVSDVYPHIAQHVDDMVFLKACTSTELNHTPACYMVNTGANRVGAPSFGSWTTYGMGTENENMPGFVVMFDPERTPEGGANLWDSAYLPGEHQAVPMHPTASPISYLKAPAERTPKTQRSQLDLLKQWNRKHLQHHPGVPALETRIRSYETAYRMQTEVPELVNVANETAATQDLYGLNDPRCELFGRQLLMARRMVESGVRCIQIYHGGYPDNWDHHEDLAEGHTSLCYSSDRPIAGLLADLKQRGLLDSTLIVWGGEFGRLPTSQDRTGRDHNPFGFAMWLAGGGVKAGASHGELDELGYKPVQDATSIHDVHATILHLMGIDPDALTFYWNGREQSLTNGLGNIIHPIVA